ncbi:hypothetical protein RTP6_7801 [Batrachochytrium dendrobatidis]
MWSSLLFLQRSTSYSVFFELERGFERGRFTLTGCRFALSSEMIQVDSGASGALLPHLPSL